MGFEINREIKRNSGGNEKGTADAGSNTRSDSANTGTRAGSGTGTGAGTGTNTEKEKVSGLVTVKEVKEDVKNKETVTKAPEQPKPKRTRKKKKEEVQIIDKANLNLMIAGLSAVIASRPDCEHWLLTEQEIDSITTPLCAMMAESEALKNMGQHANQITLVMACITVFMPRLMITAKKQKEKKEREITGNTVNTNIKSDRRGKRNNPIAKDRKHTESNPVDNGNTAPNGKDDGHDLSVYGAPIAY